MSAELLSSSSLSKASSLTTSYSPELRAPATSYSDDMSYEAIQHKLSKILQALFKEQVQNTDGKSGSSKDKSIHTTASSSNKEVKHINRVLKSVQDGAELGIYSDRQAERQEFETAVDEVTHTLSHRLRLEDDMDEMKDADKVTFWYNPEPDVDCKDGGDDELTTVHLSIPFMLERCADEQAVRERIARVLVQAVMVEPQAS